MRWLLFGMGVFSTSANARPLQIEAKIGDRSWSKGSHVSPLINQRLTLRLHRKNKAEIRWYQIIPDLDTLYKNANHPWEKNPYQWVGFDKISYQKIELTQLRNQWEILPLQAIQKKGQSRFYNDKMGSFWLQAEVHIGNKVLKSPGLESNDYRGLSPHVFRISVREEEGFLGYLSSYFNVPGLFGSVTYQSKNYIGVDCADVLVAAAHQWKRKKLSKNYNVAMLVKRWKQVAQTRISNGQPHKELQWGKDFQAGDLIAVRYDGARKYQHIGALYKDQGTKGKLDPADMILHAGPQPLHISSLQEGIFDGEVVILRP